MLIINESRAKHATVEINIKMSSNTTPASLKMLRDNVKTFVNGRPRDFVTNSIFFHCNRFQLSHFIDLVIWATCVETWSNPRVVFDVRTDLLKFVANQCKLLGINYEHALKPVYFKNSLSLGGFENFTSHFRKDYKNKDLDNDTKESENIGYNKSVGTTFNMGQTKLFQALDHFVPRVPSTLPIEQKETRILKTQGSIGPLSIENPFINLDKSFKRSETKAPPAPPLSTLKNVPKNAFTHAPPGHHPPKKSELDDYENVWLNTWSPENKPNKAKTFSFESDKNLLDFSSQCEAQDKVSIDLTNGDSKKDPTRRSRSKSRVSSERDSGDKHSKEHKKRISSSKIRTSDESSNKNDDSEEVQTLKERRRTSENRSSSEGVPRKPRDSSVKHHRSSSNKDGRRSSDTTDNHSSDKPSKHPSHKKSVRVNDDSNKNNDKPPKTSKDKELKRESRDKYKKGSS